MAAATALEPGSTGAYPSQVSDEPYRPPLWTAPWSFGLAALLIIAAAVGGYRFFMRKVKARARMLERQVTSRTRELSALNAIANVVSASLDLEEVLAGALEKTLDVTQREAGGIYLLQADSSAQPGNEHVLKLVAHRGIDHSLFAAIDGLAVGEGFSGRVVQSGEPILVPDLAADERLTRLAVKHQGYRSLAIAPLVSRGQVLGTLFVMTSVSAPLQAQDLELLTSIAGQVAVAVENARLYADTEGRLAQITALQATATAIASTLQLDELLHLITEQATDLLQADGGVLNLVDWDRREDEAVAIAGCIMSGLGSRTALDHGLSGWIALHNQPTTSRDLIADPRVDHEALHRLESAIGRHVQSAAGVPLTIKGQVIGSLVLVDKHGGHGQFDRKDLDLLVTFASQAATAIENARLFQAEQRRAEQFRVISEVGQRVTSILEVDEVLDQVVRLIQGAFGYNHVGIALIEDEYAVYKVGAGELWDTPGFEFRPRRLKVGEQGLTGWVAGTGQPLLVPDITLEPRYVPMEGSGTRSEITVPIRVKGVTIGVLDVQSQNPDAFDESDLKVLQSLANQAAISIENARLYEQAQQLAIMEERGRLARELHDAVTQTLFSASLLAEALPATWESDPTEGRVLLGELRQLSRGALAEMRTLLLELRPAVLLESNLRDLISQLGEAAGGRAGIVVQVSVDDPCPLPDDVHVALYRIVQESLNNVVKHAQASRVEVSLHCVEPHSGLQHGARVELSVVDDGRGFDPSMIPPDRLGIGIIRERAQAIGAACGIDSRPGCGTRITVRWEEAK